jgi:hypothetical protein
MRFPSNLEIIDHLAPSIMDALRKSNGSDRMQTIFSGRPVHCEIAFFGLNQYVPLGYLDTYCVSLWGSCLHKVMSSEIEGLQETQILGIFMAVIIIMAECCLRKLIGFRSCQLLSIPKPCISARIFVLFATLGRRIEPFLHSITIVSNFRSNPWC